ncbi:T9SS type A sorting domain-containing protein [Fulvivirgaceae bacterium PWU5]|uniref:T9SS type A sorting domain-containing protein n=1 Tax=Dawidia cretensis TaxID=2782350 RepID=A0AAP2E0Y6_9BACT|nr:T9SS type A sorting domain-containing protein [Dawidia cretensis]MBT1710986.1 T9SS type A sorting domain-containing protein [Dawidia cretensis]
MLLLAVLPGYAQSGKVDVCQNEVAEYSIWVGNSCKEKVNWSVGSGVFPDHGNAQSATPTIDASGYSKINVKWTGTGPASVSISGCATGQLIVYIYDVSFSVTASPTTMPLGSEVTLTAHPNNNNPIFTWTETIYGRLQSSSGPVVTAKPVATSTYTATGSMIIRLGSGDMPCSNTKTVTVNVQVPVITGNEICCTYCVPAGQQPSALSQAPGTALGGGNGEPLRYRWVRSADGVAFSEISNATGASYAPPVGSATYWYRRVVSNNGVGEIASDPVTVAVANPNTTLPATNYPLSTLRVAQQTLTIQGNQSTSGGAMVELRGGTQVLVKPGTVLYPNVAVVPFLDCFASSARMTAEEAPADVLNAGEEGDERFMIYPNPAQHNTVVQYAVKSSGSIRVILLDAVGTPVKLFVDEANAEPGLYQHTFDARALRPGLYFCVLETPEGRDVKRVSINVD